MDPDTDPHGRLRCSAQQHGGGWSMTADDDQETIGELLAGRCPICAVPLVAALTFAHTGVPARQCGCCGSQWRWSLDEVTCLPGPDTHVA